ncbi:hypothetical protein K431DRAFT_230290 [Polychaeton citri CBS 116435]|uniref:Wax synthase domain-containing protein n=1 Tax=Polychaeton citri CBS 116435 TaxID=1314669 RepID=A0A9P4Q634_9PEZI|nr:hypothetical protein K431DRAFT_230290 [Polychaeton citri CBS 116435]
MAPPNFKLETIRQAQQYHDTVYYALIENGQAQPFLYPWGTLGGAVLLTYLVIDHRQRPWLRKCRYLIFTLVSAFATYCVAYTRARGPAPTFSLGLVSCFAPFWVAAGMVFNDCQSDFQRIEYQPSEASSGNGSIDSPASLQSSTPTQKNGELRKRQSKTSPVPNGNAKVSRRARSGSSFGWQQYPDKFSIARCDWLFDVLTSFRGVGWNWQRSCVPPSPPSFENKIKGSRQNANDVDPVYTAKNGIRRYTNRKALFKSVVIRLAIGYLCLDAIKTVMSHDLYFWYPTKASFDRHTFPPPDWLPSLVQENHILLRFYRLVTALFAVQTALWTTFNLGPLFFCFILGPRLIGLRGEAWMNPDMYGSMEPVFNSGLAGWWGAHWHQVFRFSFEEPSKALLASLNIDRRSMFGRITSVFIAFFLSGLLHACGSYTCLFESNPLRGPMAFFLLQGCGVIGQVVIVQLLRRLSIVRNSPSSFRSACNFFVTYIWLYHTAHLLCDDFMAAGVFLFEPVPISLFRGLGLGAKDEGWLCWHRIPVFWHQGKHVWDTGIAF